MSLDLECSRYDCLFQVLFGCGNKGYSSAFTFQAGNLILYFFIKKGFSFGKFLCA